MLQRCNQAPPSFGVSFSALIVMLMFSDRLREEGPFLRIRKFFLVTVLTELPQLLCYK